MSKSNIRGNFAVLREGLLDFAKADKVPKHGVVMIKALVNLAEQIVLDINRIADAAEHRARKDD